MPDLEAVGAELEAAIKEALAALEQAGVSARDADEFIKDSAFKAWWDWDYEPVPPVDEPPTEQA